MASALKVDDSVATIRLEGPLDAERVGELTGFCEYVADDDAVRVCLLTGDGAVWSGWSAEAIEGAEEARLVGDPLGAFARLPQATVALLDAPLVDGGLELALCADVRVAGTGITIGLPSAGDQLPIAGGLQRLARAVGRGRALELVLISQPIDAMTARTWGLVSVVAEDPASEAAALAARIAQRGPLATRFAKEAVRRGIEMPLDQALRYETDLTVLLQTTEDRAEGVEAFVEKRDPEFHGR
ncbi:MAG: enoyl-CoA hydratase/isomerase family protein [Chloroflexi bacterium]|nr:enoyl-CoA hydratase/isomerase family protein [Chloroflexota bacterium]